MEAQNGAFPPLMIYMYRSAETSGNLDKVSMQMAEHYEKSHKLNSKYPVLRTYPGILGIMVVAVVLILPNFVLPQFDECLLRWTAPVYQDPHGVQRASAEPLDHSTVVAILVIVESEHCCLFRKYAWWHRFKLKVPLLESCRNNLHFKVCEDIEFSVFCRYPHCISIADRKKDNRNDYIDAQFDQVIPFVRARQQSEWRPGLVDGFVRNCPTPYGWGRRQVVWMLMLSSTADLMEYDADMAVQKWFTLSRSCFWLWAWLWHLSWYLYSCSLWLASALLWLLWFHCRNVVERGNNMLTVYLSNKYIRIVTGLCLRKWVSGDVLYNWHHRMSGERSIVDEESLLELLREQWEVQNLPKRCVGTSDGYIG